MAQLVKETFSRLNARMRQMTEDQAPSIDRMRRALRTYIEFGVEHPHHYRVLFNKPLVLEDKVVEAFENEGMHCFACLQRLTATAIADGSLRPELEDPAEVAQAVWTAVHGLVSLLTGSKGFPFVEQSRLIDRQVDILIEGIRRR
jgi:AcrR family transcriptional regulator